MIKKIKMENLICSSCASKIEKEISTLSYINNATFNFTTQMMLIDTTDNYNEKEALPVIKRIVDSIEDGVETYLPEKEKVKEKKKFTLLNEFTFGLILFGIALLLQDKIDSFYTLALFWIGYLLTSKTILIKTIKGIKRKDFFNENTLMFIATIAAMFLGEFFEALMVVLFYSFGEFLQHRAISKSTDEIKGLLDLKVEYTNVIENNQTIIKTPEEIEIGDTILIKTGEKVPVDGIVISGSTSLNTSALTGESKLSFVQEDEPILSGNLNTGNAIKMKATKIYKNSTVYRILDLIENSTNTKAAPETFMTKFARYYTPTVTVLALLMFIIPSMINPAGMNEYIYRAATFLVISCPCALVLSIPLSYFSGIGVSAKNGILFKSSSFLHQMTEVNTIAIDKTGTLTKGNFEVSSYSSDETLQLAASLENYSNHPIATSILNRNKQDLLDVSNIKELPGKGLIGTVNNQKLMVGNSRLLHDYGITTPDIDESSTSVFVVLDSNYMGQIVIEDQIKETSVIAMNQLKHMNITMLTGDNYQTAMKVATQVGNIHFKDSLLPEEKINEFNKLASSKPKVFIGDGINDAPLLKNADIGIAMGSGSEIAIDVADVIIMNDDLTQINKAFEIAKKTKQIVIQNIALTLGLKLLIVVLAGFGLSSMLAAIFADVGVSLIAILNTLRIIYSKKLNAKNTDTQIQKTSQIFRLCSDITILSILETLSDQTYTLDDLAVVLKESTSSLIKKINTLIEEKLVIKEEVEGTELYTVKDEHVSQMIQLAKAHSYC